MEGPRIALAKDRALAGVSRVRVGVVVDVQFVGGVVVRRVQHHRDDSAPLLRPKLVTICAGPVLDVLRSSPAGVWSRVFGHRRQLGALVRRLSNQRPRQGQVLRNRERAG